MRVASLGSGSSGNALVVQSGQTAVLVDAGFSSRTLTSRLRQVGISPTMLSAVLLTHEHSDHACGAAEFARQHRLPLISEPRTINAVVALAEKKGFSGPIERIELRLNDTTKVRDLQIHSFPTLHDAVAPCGFLLTTGAWSVCVAIDTGAAHMPILEAMRKANLLVIEANHDVARLQSGPYPRHLKERILSASGHLSNEQTSTALLNVLDDDPRWIWLAHLSRTNNTPDLARAHIGERLRSAGLAHARIQVAPPSVGPIWDSASLWGSSQQPGLWQTPHHVGDATPSVIREATA